jgi:SAM-dependent methyltransferase
MSYLNYAAGNTALDIGAGAGFYGTALQTRGFEVTGVDLMERSDLPYPVVQGALHDLSHIQAADTVLAFDVLEHEPNEAAALRELRRLTKKRLLLSVPNGDRTLLTSYNLTYKHHTDKTHMREYTEAELRGKLELAGFRILIMAHEGPVKASFLAEFVRPKALRVPVRWLLKALQRVKLLHNDRLMADLYVVAEPT